MPGSSDFIVVGIVILARLVLPLFIPKYPLPAVIACLIVDGVDQTVFQTFTRLNLDWYQSYDKALDIYYLVIAYLSTLRNWRNQPAFQISRFLLYYRLIGTAAFEFTQWRPLLLIFPNTFEYFFIYYEALRTRWNPMRRTQREARRYWLIVAAAIWVFIKLPQEWWIHIAEFDTTDLVKERLFGASKDAPFMAAIGNRPWVAVAAVAVVVLLALAVRYLLIPRLPAPHHRWEFAAEPLPRRADTPEERRRIFALTRQPIDAALLEKVVLVTLVTLIFARILPGYRATDVQLVLAVIAIITLNSFVSYWFAHHGVGWRSAAAQFAALLLVNTLILLAAHFLLRGGPIQIAGQSAFLLALLTLLITLYDYFRPAYSARFETRGRGGR